MCRGGGKNGEAVGSYCGSKDTDFTFICITQKNKS